VLIGATTSFGACNVFKETHPILGTRDIQRAIEFYIQKLGFYLAFRDNADSPCNATDRQTHPSRQRQAEFVS
jgi:hypothetical protein